MVDSVSPPRGFGKQPIALNGKRKTDKLDARALCVRLSRQLAVDLWRWRTGRCTMADLGWVAA